MDFELPPRFEVVGLLGSGGMGSVYEVFDRDRSETIALKTLEGERARNVAAIKGEFRVLTGIAHPNVVTFYELFEHAGRWFFTMERVAGVGLLEWVRGAASLPELTIGEDEVTHDDAPARDADVGDLDPERLRDAMRQLARGLLAFHRAGRVHRDVKPSNVVVTSEGRVVLLDFGIAVTGGEVSRVGGTISYMAPEQAKRNSAVRPPADAYALGIVAYEAMTGTVPFDGAPGEVLGQKLELDAPAVSTRTEGPLPEDLEALTMALLQRDPGERPTMLEILEAIEQRSEKRDAVAVVEREAPLVGRDPLLAACSESWNEAKRCGPVAISLIGPDGIGRTRVLEEVAKLLRAENVAVVETRADARESIPFRGLDPIVDMLVSAERQRWETGAEPGRDEDVAHVASLFPALYQLWPDLAAQPRAIPDPIEVRRRGFLGLSRWIRKHAPLAVLIDDAHDLDGDGLALLTALLRPSRPLPLLVILAAREEPPLQSRVLPISPLSDEEAHRLARALIDTGSVDQLVDAAKGRPGWLVELAYETRSSIEIDIGRAVRRRLQTLPPGTRMLLNACVLAYTPLDIALASRVTGADRETVIRDAQRLTAAHLLRREAVLEVPSGIVRDAVRKTIPDDVARTLHESLASALGRRPRIDRELVARHHADAGQRELAVRLASRAQEEAEGKLAFERSAELAAFLAELDPEQAGVHLSHRARALGYAGRGRESAEAYLAAIEKTEHPVVRRAMRRLAAKELIRAGHPDRGIELIREALSEVGVPMPKNARRAIPGMLLRRARLLLRGDQLRERTATPFELERIDACWAACSLLTIDIYWAAYFQTLHLQYALDSGDAACAARALALEVPLLAAAGRAKRASRFASHARELAQRSGDAHAEGLVEGSIGFGLLQSGQFTAALRAARKGETILEERTLGTFWERSTLQLVQSWALAWRGDLRKQRSYLQDMRAVAAARGDVYANTNLVLATSAWGSLLDDEPGQARADVSRALMAWPMKGMQVPHLFALIADGIISVYERDATCLERLDAAMPAVRRSMLLQNQLLRVTWTDIQARLALVAGDLPRARKAGARLAKESAHWASPLAEAIAAQTEAGPGPHWETAARRFERAGMGMHAAAAQHMLGEHFASSDWVRENRPAKPMKLLAAILPAAR